MCFSTLTQTFPLFLQVVVIDGRGHMLGRLASIVAKQLLQGQHVVSPRLPQPLITWAAAPGSSVDGCIFSAAAAWNCCAYAPMLLEFRSSLAPVCSPANGEL